MAVLAAKQSGSEHMDSTTTSIDVTVSTYDPATTILWARHRNDDASDRPEAFALATEKIDSTTIRFSRPQDARGSTIDVEWELTEYSSGVSVQDIEWVVGATAEGSTDIAITAVDRSKSFVLPGGQAFTAFPGSSVYEHQDAIEEYFTTDTNVHMRMTGTQAEFFATAQVVEYDGASVQELRHSQSGTTFAESIPSAVDTTKTIHFSSGQFSGGTERIYAIRVFTTWLSDGSTLSGERYQSNNTWDITSYIVELTDGSSVQNVSASLPDTVASSDETISAITIAESTSHLTGVSVWPQATAACDVGDWDWGVLLHTSEFFDSTTLRLTRGVASGPAAARAQVVSWNTSGGGGPTVVDLDGTAAGSSTVTADISATVSIAGSSAGSAVASGDLGIYVSIAGTAAGSATVAGDLVVVTSLAGAAAGQSTSTADLVAYGNLTGTSAGLASLSASLSAWGNLEASSAGAATSTADLGTYGNLEATSAGAATAVAELTVGATLSGSAAGAATVAGGLTALASLQGAAAGVATAAADLGTYGNLAGSAAGSSTVTGLLDSAGQWDIEGTAAGSSTATADISVLSSLDGSASGQGTATANLVGLASLEGTAAGTATATAEGSTVVSIAGSAAGSSVAEAELDAYTNIEGSTAGVATVAGEIENANEGALFGSSTGTATVAAELGALVALSGTSQGVATVTASIEVEPEPKPEPEPDDSGIIRTTPFGFVEIPLWFYPFVRRLQWRIPVKISAWLSDVEREIALAEIADATKGWAQWQVVEDRPDLGGPYKLTLRAKSRSSREEREVSIEFLPIHRRTRAQFLAHLKIASDQLRL